MVPHFKHLLTHARPRGFTLLLAALVSSIVLSLGAAIYGIAIKQVQLSAIGRDSQFAFYAADSAAECALYFDSRSDKYPNTFATSSGDTGHGTSVTCDNQQAALSVDADANDPNVATTTFSYAPEGYCAAVSVGKDTVTDASGQASLKTTIRADGFSVQVSTTTGADIAAECAAAISSSPNALERSIELHY